MDIDITDLNIVTEEQRRRADFLGRSEIYELEDFGTYLAKFGVKHLGGTKYTLAEHDMSRDLSRRQISQLRKRTTAADRAFSQDFIDGKTGPKI